MRQKSSKPWPTCTRWWYPKFEGFLGPTDSCQAQVPGLLGDHWPLLDQVWWWPRVSLHHHAPIRGSFGDIIESYIAADYDIQASNALNRPYYVFFEEYPKHPVLFSFYFTFLLLRQSILQVQHDWRRSHVQCHLPGVQGHNDHVSMAEGFHTLCQSVFAQNC